MFRAYDQLLNHPLLLPLSLSLSLLDTDVYEQKKKKEKKIKKRKGLFDSRTKYTRKFKDQVGEQVSLMKSTGKGSNKNIRKYNKSNVTLYLMDLKINYSLSRDQLLDSFFFFSFFYLCL